MFSLLSWLHGPKARRVGLTGILAASAGAAAACDAAHVLALRVLPVVVEAENATLSIADMTALHHAHGLEDTEPGLGATTSQRVVTVEAPPRGCPALTVDTGWAPFTVWVARELRADPCAFEHVRAHEYVHVDIYRRFAAELPARLRAMLTGDAVRLARGDSRAPSVKEIADRVAQLLDEVDARHRQHDTPQEYGNNRLVCGGFVNRLLPGHGTDLLASADTQRAKHQRPATRAPEP